MSGFCNDYGDAPGCLREPDERYTMRFDDLGEPPLLWCTVCGIRAHAMWRALEQAYRERPGFHEDLKREVDQAERERVKQ